MKTKPHYAWVICAACTMLVFCNLGIVSDSISYYLPYIKEIHGYSGTASSAIMTVKSVTAFFCTPLIVSYYDRFTMRRGGALTCAMGAFSYCLFALAESLPVYYLAAACAGVAYSLGGTTAAALLAGRWFAQRKGFAMGIAAAGNGVACFIFPPLVAVLVENFGKGFSCLVQAAICAFFGVIFFLIARDKPADKGLEAYGAGGQEGAAVKIYPDKSLPAGRMLLCRLALVFLGGAAIGSSSHYMILFVSNGVDAALVSVVMSLSSVFMIMGKFTYGAICDKIGGRRGSVLFLVMLGTVHLLASGMKNGNVVLMCLILLWGGLAFAPGTVGVSIWATDFSAEKDFPSNLKWLQTGYTLGGLVCSVLPGVLYDLTGSYNPAYLVFAIFVFTAMIILYVNYRYMEKTAKNSEVSA